MSAIVQETFDYSVVDDAAASSLRRAAEAIRGYQRSAVRDIIAIGKELIKAKEHLGHGQFARWLEAEFRINERRAQRWMRVAEEFGAKSDIVSVLPKTLIYDLSAKSTPPTIRESVVAQLEAGEEVDLDVIETEVETARRDARQERRRRARQVGKRHEARRTREREKEREEEDQRCQRALAIAQELIEEFMLPVVTRILDAANDLYVRDAIRKLREQPNDGLDIPPILRRSASASAAVRND